MHATRGRTRQYLYQGKLGCEAMKKVKNMIEILVIASGNINTLQIAKKVLAFTEANAIIMNRAALA